MTVQLFLVAAPFRARVQSPRGRPRLRARLRPPPMPEAEADLRHDRQVAAQRLAPRSLRAADAALARILLQRKEKDQLVGPILKAPK